MSVRRFHSRIGTVAATLILPILALAGPGPIGGPQGPIHPPGPISGPPRPVPEVNPMWVLIPLVGAVMFLSARRLRRSHTH